jgi:hypothetical protein
MQGLNGAPRTDAGRGQQASASYLHLVKVPTLMFVSRTTVLIQQDMTSLDDAEIFVI